jgi:hypothetical protein
LKDETNFTRKSWEILASTVEMCRSYSSSFWRSESGRCDCLLSPQDLLQDIKVIIGTPESTINHCERTNDLYSSQDSSSLLPFRFSVSGELASEGFLGRKLIVLSFRMRRRKSNNRMVETGGPHCTAHYSVSVVCHELGCGSRLDRAGQLQEDDGNDLECSPRYHLC